MLSIRCHSRKILHKNEVHPERITNIKVARVVNLKLVFTD